jgi:hypothetical protein
MRIRALCLFAAAIHAAFAQSGAPVEVQVRNRASGAGVAGANVTLFALDELTQRTIRYVAVTGPSGSFRFADVEPGQYQVMIEKSGFATFPKDPVQVQPRGAAVAVQYQLSLGIAPRAKLIGRVLDSDGKPAPRAHVVLIRGPELQFVAETDSDGQFAFAQVDEGAYTLMAAPEMRAPAPAGGEPKAGGQRKEGPRTADVATFFPSSLEPTEAQRIAVKGEMRIKDFRLQSAPVASVRGVVIDHNGRPVAGATLRLVPVSQQPAHVVLSFDSYFFAIGEGPGPGPEVATGFSSNDGTFEFAAVPRGRWNILAQGAAPIDPQFGIAKAPSGSTAIDIANSDLQDVRVSLENSVDLAGSARWGIRCVSARLSCGTRSAEAAVVPVWFRSADGGPNTLRPAVVRADGTFQVDDIPSDPSFIQVLPPLLNGNMVMGAGVSSRLSSFDGEAVDLARRDPLNIALSGSFAEGGPVILDTVNPVDISNSGLKMDNALSGSVHGVVEGGAAAAVVIVPEQYTQGARGILAFCQPDGSFDALELLSGAYRIAAFSAVDLEALRDPDLFARVLSSDTQVTVELGQTTQVQLKPPISWP